jgi:hypothetical protein
VTGRGASGHATAGHDGTVTARASVALMPLSHDDRAGSSRARSDAS